MLLPFLEYKYMGDDIEFLQGNVTIYKSKLTKNWFQYNSIKLVPFPSNSTWFEFNWKNLDWVKKCDWKRISRNPRRTEKINQKNWKTISLKETFINEKKLRLVFEKKFIKKIQKYENEKFFNFFQMKILEKSKIFQ